MFQLNECKEHREGEEGGSQTQGNLLVIQNEFTGSLGWGWGMGNNRTEETGKGHIRAVPPIGDASAHLK